MIAFLRFVAAIALYFAAADLLIEFLNIEEGTNTWLLLNIFSGAIGIIAAFFVSGTATAFIGLYLIYDIGSTFWNNKGFFNILFLCADSLIQFAIFGFLVGKYKEVTGKEYGEDE